MSYETKTLATGKPLTMKPSRSAIHHQTYVLPALRFEDQQLTSFSGLVIFQPLFEYLRLKNRVRDCFRHLRVRPIFGHTSIVILLIIHMGISKNSIS